MLKINFLFAAILSALIYLDKSGLLFSGFLSILFHEFGHIFAMLLKKQKIHKIEFKPFGIEIVNHGKITIFVLFSGAISNFIVAIILILLYNFLGINFLKIVAMQNICIGILNLLPVGNLDGGQILFLIIEKKFDFEVAEKILKIFSCLIIFPIAILGFLILIYTKYNFSLLFLACYLIVILINKEYII